jgi:hypothetical protein
MHELAELARLREDVPPAPTDRAYERLADAMTGSARTAGWQRQGNGNSRKLVIAMSAAAAVIAVAITAAVLGVPSSGTAPGPTTRPNRPASRLLPWPAGLAPLAIRGQALALRYPRFSAPSPKDWAYTDMLRTLFPGIPNETAQFWQQIGTDDAAGRINGGRLTRTSSGGPGGYVFGWRVSMSNIYAYLARLPASPAALRAVILANLRTRHTLRPEPSIKALGGLTVAVFDVIQPLFLDAVVPPRLQAEFLSVLASLPGVRLDPDVTDAAGRQGVGLYIRENAGSFEELIFSPVTCTYLGEQWYQVRRDGQRGPAMDEIAALGSGIVQRAGQLPSR